MSARVIVFFRVKVSIGRATPLNMITAADLLRKGDRVEKVPY